MAQAWSGFEVEWLAQVCGGWLTGEVSTRFDRFATDTRGDVRGALFAAIRGDRFDGHRFLQDAARSGAVAALVEDGRFRPHEAAGFRSVVVVPDVPAALAAAASAHRDRMPAEVIGLTGSCGKTTTKELLAAALRAAGPVLSTPGNLNNHLGVPATLLAVRPEHRFAVVEMGCNRPGEIAALARIARPRLGLITCVAPVHLEGLGTLDGVAAAKGELFAALEGEGATAVVNLDDVRAAAIPSPGARRIGVGRGEDADVRIESSWPPDAGGDGYRFRLRLPDRERVDVLLAVPGGHQVANGALAAAAAWVCGAPVEGIAAGLAAVRPGRGRGRILRLPRGVVLLDDTYNSNAAAACRALALLGELPGSGRKVAILGEMLELGEAAPAEHRRVGEAAAREGVGLLVCVGPSAPHAAEGATVAGLTGSSVLVFEDAESALAAIEALIRPGDHVLVKGSRGMRMERFVDRIAGGGGDAV